MRYYVDSIMLFPIIKTENIGNVYPASFIKPQYLLVTSRSM